MKAKMGIVCQSQDVLQRKGGDVPNVNPIKNCVMVQKIVMQLQNVDRY